MVSRIRLILVNISAILMMTAVVSTSASAATKCTPTEEGGDYAVCVKKVATEPGKEYEGPLANDNTAVMSELVGEVGGAKAKLTGTFAKGELIAEDSGKSKGKIEFKNITVEKPAGCIVKEPIVAEFKDQLSTPPAAITDTFTGSKPGETFVEIEFKDKGTEACPVKNTTFAVVGSQECTFDAGIENMIEHHELICPLAGSKLKLGGKAAKFQATLKEVEPSEVDSEFEEWAIRES